MIRKFCTISLAALALAACGNMNSADAQGAYSGIEIGAVDPGRVNSEALQSAVSDPTVRAFYENRGWQAVWTRDQARELGRALGESERHALEPAMFLSQEANSGDPVRTEAALTHAALAYASALARGRANPARVHDLYTIPRPRTDVAAGLAQAMDEGTVREWLAGLAPQDDEYRALSEAFLHYRDEARNQQDSLIETGDTIRQGDNDPRVPQIVEVLRADGYLEGAPRNEDAGSTVYNAQIAAAVERLQEDYGIAADGVIGSETLEVLNTGAAERARQIAVNLERRRWLERRPPATRIDVNMAAAELDYWNEGRHADRRRVVVGRPERETPQLGSPIFRLVANPSWTVPKSIEEEDIAPRGEDYLRRNNMVRQDGWVVQRPGPDNALGLVKFDMQNDHAIYLHDTPAKELFERNQRYYSAGCVRVHDALGFARMLAEHQGVGTEFERALATGDETFVDLDSHIPVRLVYHTAFVRGGEVVFRTDPYGWDEDIAAALGLDGRERRNLRRQGGDIGP